MAAFVLLFLSFLHGTTASFGTYEVTRRDFPFVDASRCRQPDFCGLSLEWDLKFGRPIAATAYFPGNATHTFNVSNMNVLIFGALKGNDKFNDILTNISSAGVVVISVALQNKQSTFDYVQDILRVAFDMYYENDNIHSHLYQKLSGSTVIVGYGEMAESLLWINHEQNCPHPSIKGIVSLSPSLQRDPDVMIAATSIRINVLFIAGTADAWRPISNQRPIYTQVPTGKTQHKGVCKTYVEIEGGNHCYFVDYDSESVSECYTKEMECPSFKTTSITHQYQLNTYSARILFEYLRFASDPTIETATNFQQYLIHSRDTTGGDIQYLQSCYVDHILFAHDQYFPQDSEQVQYRTVH
eukprot:57840_1